MRYVVMLGAVAGVLFVLAGLLLSASAPQMAAMAAMGCAVAIIPYVGYRASQLDVQEREHRQFHRAVVDRLAALEKPRQD